MTIRGAYKVTNYTKAQRIIIVHHQRPNGVIATYDLKLLGYQIISGSADGFIQLKVSGRHASDVDWLTVDDLVETQTTENEDDGE